MVESSFRSSLDEKVFLTFINNTDSAEELSKRVRDDPLFGSRRGRGLSPKLARRILQYREELPGGQFEHPAQLLDVHRVGPDTYHDIVSSFERMTAIRKFLIVVNHASGPESFREIIRSVSGGEDPWIDDEEIEGLMGYRAEQAGGVVHSVDELIEQEVLRPETIENIQWIFERDRRRHRAVDRMNLGTGLKPFLAPGPNRPGLIGSDDLREAVDVLLEQLGDREANRIGALFHRAAHSGGIVEGERVADVIFYPPLSDHVRPGPPSQLVDPASFPDIPPGYDWLRTGGGVVLKPKGTARLEWLTPEGWVQGLTVKHSIRIEPVKKGVIVRSGGGGLMSGLGTDERMVEHPLPAVRITCRNGVGGILLGYPHRLDLSGDAKEIVPHEWGMPGREIWVNPIPGLPPMKHRPGKGPGCLPTGVVVGGGSCPPGVDPGQEEEDSPPAVVLGIGPQVFINGTPGFTFGVRPGPPRPGARKKGGGWWWGPVGFIDDGDDVLTVSIKGCPCIRKPNLSEYVAEPSEEGGSYEWSVDDDEIAEIEGPKDQKTCKLQSKKIGRVTLSVQYTKNGQTVDSSLGIAVMYQRYTPRNRPRSEKTAMPLIHPAPKIRIAPHQNHPLTPDDIDPDRHRAKFLLDVQGELKDALIDIRGVEVTVGSHFRRRLSRSGNQYGEYDDDRFVARQIELYGPGRSFVRVKATNSIGFVGTDTMEVVTRIPQHWENTIAMLEDFKQAAIERGGQQRELDGYDRRLREAWTWAIKSAEHEFGFLTHTEDSVSRAPGNEKWSIAVEDDARSGTASIVTSFESQTVNLKERSTKLLAPENKPRNYFLLHQDYDSDRLNWDEDGRLLAAPGEPVNLVYGDICCAHVGPGTGVELESPGSRRIKPGESITLKAHGLPPEFMGVTGQYTWSCVAHPPGAEFRFDPESMPTPANTVEFVTDTPGVYTFKVAYQLIDAQGPWTYALADGQIVFEVDAVTEIHRVGDYDGELADHRDRPYYRERGVEKQPGAEVMVRERNGGMLGQDLEFELFCPRELKFEDSLKAKVFYADGKDRTFNIHVDGDHRFYARMTLRSTKPVERVHILGIQYGNLQRSKGDAVWIDVRVRPLAPQIIDLAETGASPPTGPDQVPDNGSLGHTVAVVEEDPIGVTPPDPEEEPADPVVNLILRTRDLGPATACNGMISLSPFVSESNLTNGNHFFDLLLFTMQGMGMSLSPSLHYNSRSATRAAAVRLYGKLNGKDRDTLDREWGPELLGDGWGGSHYAQLIEYVDVEGNPLDPRLIRCAEVLFINGNRIAFERTRSGPYQVRSGAECVGDKPNAALGMVLERDEVNDRWRLTDAMQNRWIFDPDGRLIERNSPSVRAPGSTLEPIQWEWSDSELVIRDSAGREITIARDNAGRVSTITAPNQAEFSLTYEDHQLRTIECPEEITWAFDYITDHSLLSKLTPPEGHELELDYYLEGPFDQVPEERAREYWGRVGKQSFGERDYWIRYQEFARDPSVPQVVICEDAEGFRWRYRYETERQAVTRLEVARSDHGDDWTRTVSYNYYEDTKLVRTRTDRGGAETSYLYTFDARTKAHPIMAVTGPSGAMRNYDYNGDGLLETFTDEESQNVTYEYHANGQYKTIQYPAVPVITTDLQQQNQTPVEKFEYDDRGRVGKHTSVDGIETVYEYDPDDKTGLPTRITTGSHTRTLTYDVMGNEKTEKNPLGSTTEYDYDELGRIKTITRGSMSLDYEYDRLNRVRTVTDGAGRTTETSFNEYGEIEFVKNQMGHYKRFLEHDRRGNVLKVQHEDGSVYEYDDYDAFGRWRRQRLPDVRRSGEDGLTTPNMPDVVRRFVDDPEVFQPTGEPTTREIIETGSRTRTLHYDGRGNAVAREVTVGSRTHAVVLQYNPRGHVISRSIYENGRRKAIPERAEWDALGRQYKQIVGHATLLNTVGRDQDGLYKVELLPAQHRQQGRTPSTITRLDDRYRPVRVMDGENKPVVEYRYDDDRRTVEVWTVDPSRTESDAPLLHTLTVEFDTEGRVKKRTDKRVDQSITFNYDALGRVDTSQTPLGTITYEYDDMDRLVKRTIPVPVAGGGVIPSGRNASPPTRESGSLTEEVRYDPAGRVEFRGTPLSSIERRYDALGRITRIIRNGPGTSGAVTEVHHYNRFGERTSVWIGPGHYNTFEHDFERNRTVETFYRGGRRQGTRTVVFDPAGNVKTHSETGAQGVEFDLDYDDSDRLIQYRMTWQGREIAEVEYDFTRNLKPDNVHLSYGGSFRRTSYGYNSNLLTTLISDSDLSLSEDYRFEYNRAGLRTALQRWTASDARTSYTYHPHGTLKEIKHVLGDDWEKQLITRIREDGYDEQGNPERLTHVYLDEGEPEPEEDFLQDEQHEYDDANRLISSQYRGLDEGLLFDAFDDQTLQKRDFYYDENNRKVVEFVRMTPDTDDPDEQIFEIVSLTYGQGNAVKEELREWYLVDQTTPNYLHKKFEYDEVGRRTHVIETMTRSGDAEGTWARLTEYKYGVHDQPRQIRVFEKRDRRIYMISDTNFVYDPFNRMVFSSQTRYYEEQFGKEEHDPELSGDHASRSDFDSASVAPLQPSGSTGRFYVYAGDDLVAILDEDGKPVQEYLNGPGTNARLALKQNNELFDYYLDHRGGSLALTELDGSIERTYRQFGTWGEFQETREEAVQGGNWSDPTGHLQSGVRKYDAAAGQFISPDPLGLKGGINQYAFAGNNPIARTDGSGQIAVSTAVAIGLAVAWAAWEIRQWIWASQTGDPSHETSPLFKIYHGARGQSVFGGPGSSFDQMHYEEEYGQRAWDIFVGALSILGVVVPFLHAGKLITVSGHLTRTGRLFLFDAGANMGVGVVETARGNYLGGMLQTLFGAVGLGFFGRGLKHARQMAFPPGGSQLRNLRFGRAIEERILHSNLPNGRLLTDPVEPVPRPVMTQTTNQNCAPTACGMILRTLGLNVDQHTIDMIWDSVRRAGDSGWGTATEDLFAVYRRFVPNARYVPKGSLTVEDLARAVENGHPVHLGIRHPMSGHAIVVDGVERGLSGQGLRFWVRDPSGAWMGGLADQGIRKGVSVLADDLGGVINLSDAIFTNPSRWL